MPAIISPDQDLTISIIGTRGSNGGERPLIPVGGSPRVAEDQRRVDLLMRNFLRSRMEGPDKDNEGLLNQRVEKMDKLYSQLSHEGLQDFLNSKYAQDNIERFLDMDPQKVDLALRVTRKVNALSKLKKFEPQFVPGLNLASFSLLEMIKDLRLSSLNAGLMKAYIERLSTDNSLPWGRQSLYRHAVDYLSHADPNLNGDALEDALIREASLDIHDRLSKHTEGVAELGQPQGIEIEVLKYITSSPLGLKRGVDVTKWVPRGIPLQNHARTDWNLLPLLGINEDVGERKYQRYEVATDPSETVTAQSSLIFELMAAGFITESQLSDQKEGFSLHVSTVFPKVIINADSLHDYRGMARALAGGFASDQRVSFGGFMSGGMEIADKSAAGTLKEIGKRKLCNEDGYGIAQDKALIEIRNLDITPKGQYSALLRKEVMDYSFRCAWQKKLEFGRKLTPLEELAAQKWTEFNAKLTALESRYGISEEQLKAKFGDKWEDQAWKEMAAARESHPELKDEFARLIRGVTSEILDFKKRAEKSPVKPNTKFLLFEPQSHEENSIFLSKEARDKMGVKSGDTITLRYKNKVLRLAVAKARYRGDSTVEDVSSPFIRVSEDVFSKLKVPNGFACIPSFDQAKKEFQLTGLEAREELVKVREPRQVISEPLGFADNRFYVSLADRQRFGVKSGDEIIVRFGTMKKKVKVTEAKLRNGIVESPDAGNWRLSQNIVDEFGIPAGFPLRTKYDPDTKEFTFGASIGFLKNIETLSDGRVIVSDNSVFFRSLSKNAGRYGAFACVIDPNQQDPAVVESGMVDAYVLGNNNTLRHVRIPIPDVSYDKEISKRSEVGEALYSKIEHHVVPEELKSVTVDKLKFAELIQSNGLAANAPDTVGLRSVDDMVLFFQKNNSVILKPRFGQRGAGIIRVEKQSDGYVVRFAYGELDKKHDLVEKKVETLQEVFELTKDIRRDRKYIMQERIRFAKYKTTQDGKTVERTPEIRVVVQRGIDGKARVSGMVVRLIDPQFTGEEYLEDPEVVLQQLFPGQEDKMLEVVRKLAVSTNSLIERAVRTPVGELSIDIGVQEDGKIVLIEANSKAETRAMFAEIKNKDAEYNSTAKPLEFGLFLTDME